MMNSTKIISLGYIVLSLQTSFSEGVDKYKAIHAARIKEIPGGEKMVYLKNHPDADTNQWSEERRLKVCKEGFKHIRKTTQWGWKGKDEFLKGTPTMPLKTYIVVDAEADTLRMLPAYLCPTNPPTYIHVNFSEKNEVQPMLHVINKISRSPPVFEKLMYLIEFVDDIEEADVTDMMSTGRFSIKILLDDELDRILKEEQRLQVCIKGIQMASQFKGQVLEIAEIGATKFYKTGGKKNKTQEIIEAFRCPTTLEMYISLYAVQEKTASLLVTIKPNDDSYKTTFVDKLGAISHNPTAELLYLQTKNASLDIRRSQIIDRRTQDKICDAIFRNTIFDKRKTKSFLLDAIICTTEIDTYNRLMTAYPNLCGRLYKSSDSATISGTDVLLIGGTEIIDVNISRTQERVQEEAFICLVRHSVDDIEPRPEFVEYFISREYNMNTGKDSLDDSAYYAGRFVFKLSPNNDIADLIAIVEKPAEALKVENVELSYLERRLNREPTVIDSDDPLCKLNSHERSRICTLIFSFKAPEGLRPTALHDLGCAKNRVTFKTIDGKGNADGNLYSEWMITCYEFISEISKDDSRVYYLSHAYKLGDDPSFSGDVFAYTRSCTNAEIVLEDIYDDPRIGSILKGEV